MGNKTPNLNLPLIDVTNFEDLQLKFIEFVASICGVDNASALSILDSIVSSNTEQIRNLNSTKQNLLIPGENITIDENNVISGVGGVNEEDVMDIIENNAEQTDTLEIEDATEIGIGTSETFDATSDEQIPTSKAVSDLMAGAGGDKLYKHYLFLRASSSGMYFDVPCIIVNRDSSPFTYTTLNNYLATSGTIRPLDSYVFESKQLFIISTIQTGSPYPEISCKKMSFTISENDFTTSISGWLTGTIMSMTDYVVEI